MKKLLLISALLCAVFCSSCSESYDDSALRNDLSSLEARVARLEELCKQMNTNISSLQTIVSAMQDGDFITGVTPITKEGEIIGYTITFAKNNSITIYHGEDGKDGINGNDGHTPIIGVKQDNDGIYYWTIDGEWLLDDTNNKIKAEGVNGQDGENGTNGITPQLKIENDYWYISYDYGKTWEKLGKAKGENGENGKDGENGEDGDSMFTSIDTTSSSEYVIFTLSDGTQIKIPTWSAFEALRTQCNQMNTNIESLQQLINVLQSHDYIKSVTPLMENGTQVGYTITFAYSNPITIYSSASAPTAPVIGVKKDTDNVYYWTLDGEWLLDDNGNKIKAEGKNGSNGTNGTDGITPKLKIEDGYWYVSYDNGASWTKLGKATGADGSNGIDGVNGENGDNIFSSLTQDEEYVYFNLADGTIITLPKQNKENIQFEDLQVKAICCKNWDTNYDGELSYTEAAAVTTIGNAFYNTKIIAFNELKYFTGITTLSGRAFSHCTSLWKIEIPENVITIEDGESYNGEIRGTFSNTAITNIVIPNSVTSIGKYAFRFCNYLKSIKLGDCITRIGYEAFRHCISLSDITLPNNLIEIESNVFYDCETLTSITIPKNVSTLGDPIIYSCDNLRIVYCMPTTPPTLSGNKEPFGGPSYTSVGIIYVPTASVETYKNKLGWKDYANKITGYNFE